MRDIPTQANGGVILLDADDFNSMSGEVENAIVSTGQTLDPSLGPDTDLNMLGKALADYGSGSDYYVDTGAVNAYVLNRSGTLKNVSALRNGMRVAFFTSNTNTGAATANVASLGVKNIKLPGGVALPANTIRVDRVNELRYNSVGGYFELEVDPRENDFRGALVGKSTDQAVPSGSLATLAFGTEAYDTDSIHDTVTNNERLTIPSGVTKVKLKAQIRFEANSSGFRSVVIVDSAGTFLGRGRAVVGAADATEPTVVPCSTPVVEVTAGAGRHFYVQVEQDSGVSLDVIADNETWFAMEIID